MSDLITAVQRYVDARLTDPEFELDAHSARREVQAALTRLERIDRYTATVELGELLLGLTVGPAALTREQALYLAVTAVNIGVARSGEDGISVEQARHNVVRLLHGCYPTEQAALLAAVRQLGGHRKVGIAAWQEMALADADRTACEHVTREVELAIRHTAPGRQVAYVYDAGYVLFEGP